MNKKCAILVNSCDAYEDVWDAFFSLFHIMWKDCPYPVFLNTESKFYFSNLTNIIPLHPTYTGSRKKISWSKRLRLVLNQIDADYILMFLEDFFLMSPVRGEVIQECIDWLDEEHNIVCVRMENSTFYEDEEKRLGREFSPIRKNWEYIISTQAALWRKDFLLEILRDDESAWDFEGLGSARYNRKYYPQGKYIYTHRASNPVILDYQFLNGSGYGIVQGRWQKKNCELFEKYGIKVDFNKRGFIEDEKTTRYYSLKQRAKMKWNREVLKLKKRFKP